MKYLTLIFGMLVVTLQAQSVTNFTWTITAARATNAALPGVWLESLTNELGFVFRGSGPLDGTVVTLGTVTTERTTNTVFDHTGRKSSYTADPEWFLYGTNRWWITNVTETRTLRFQWRGKPQVLTETVPISSTTNWQYLKQDWVPGVGINPAIPERSSGLLYRFDTTYDPIILRN